MYILSNNLLVIAWQARNRAQAAKTEQVNWTSDATIAIIFSAAATEGFINELAELVRGRKQNPNLFRIPPNVCAFADAWEEVESSHGSIRLKYLISSQILSGAAFDKGSNPFQDFDLLIKLRDDHMHLKSKDTELEKVGDTFVTKPKGKYIHALTDRGLAMQVEEGLSVSWLHRVQTAEMADWACQTALNIILKVLDMFPDGNHMEDMAHSFKIAFRPNTFGQKLWDARS
jgi:hypothetical protein